MNDPAIKIYRVKPDPALDPTSPQRASTEYHAPTLDDYERISLAEALDIDLRFAELIMDVTFFCSFRCSYCEVRSKERTGLDWEQVLIPLKAMSLTGIRAAALTGGEPGIYRHTPRILQDLRDLRIETIVFTNGYWAKSQRRLDTITRARPLGFLISYKAFNEADYKKLTGVALPTRVMKQALENFSGAAARGEFEEFRIDHVLTSLSAGKLSELMWLADLPSPPKICMAMVEPHNLSTIDIYPDPGVLVRSFEKLFPALDKRGITYVFESVPLCLLGEHWRQSLDVRRVTDHRPRIYIRPHTDGDQILIHSGYQRLIQYGYLEECDSCAKRGQCAGVHKRAMKYYRKGGLVPFTH